MAAVGACDEPTDAQGKSVLILQGTSQNPTAPSLTDKT